MRSKYSIPEWYKTITSESELILVAIDMQKLFITDENSPWADPDLSSIVPNIKTLCKKIGAGRTLFTQFTPPLDWQSEKKSWRTYYYYNKKVTTELLGTEAIEIIDKFDEETGNPATTIVPKKTASAFASPQFRTAVERKDPLFLIMTGIETDYCVLSTALDALNQGYYVVVIKDACASSSENGQRNAEGIFLRFPEQLWLTSTSEFITQLKST